MRTFIYRAKALCLCVRLTSVLALIFSSFFFDSAAFGQHGAQTAPVALDQLVQSAETILRGHVVSAAMEPHPQFANLQTVVVTISVAKVLKGEAPATFSFRQFVWDARDISDNASYRKAGELLLFLNPVSPYGLTSPVGLDQGRFRVLRDAKGKAFAQNGRANFGLFNQVVTRVTSRGIALSREAQTMMAKPAGQASLDALEDAIGSLVSAKK